MAIRWEVLWCGGRCAGGPHKTKKAAQAWLDRHLRDAKAAKVAVYGSYTIVKIETGATKP